MTTEREVTWGSYASIKREAAAREAEAGEGPKPMTRQRSKWEPHEAASARAILASAGALDVTIWQRNVHDGRLVAVVAGDEPTGWHMSISHNKRVKGGALEPGRYPTWDEIADARYELLPTELDFVMHLPPPDEYVAVHDTTFHLHQHPPKKDLP